MVNKEFKDDNKSVIIKELKDRKFIKPFDIEKVILYDGDKFT